MRRATVERVERRASPASRASPPCHRARRCRRRSARRRSAPPRPPRSRGWRTATVPSTTRVAPSSNASARRRPASASRRRTGSGRLDRGADLGEAAQVDGRSRPQPAPTGSSLRGSVNAPSRLTTCSHSAPCSAQRRATAAGSSPNVVCAAGSPWRRRTTCPLAQVDGGEDDEGHACSALLPSTLTVHDRHKVAQDAQPHRLALLRVALDAPDAAAAHDRGVADRRSRWSPPCRRDRSGAQ